MATATLNLQPYESLFIVPPEITPDKVDAFVEKIKAMILKDEGVFKSVQIWGRRRLAYPIKHNKEGVYVYLDFDCSPTVSKDIHTLFNVTDMVIRHITVVREEAPPPRVIPPLHHTEKSEVPVAPETQALKEESPSKEQ